MYIYIYIYIYIYMYMFTFPALTYMSAPSLCSQGHSRSHGYRQNCKLGSQP